MPTCIDSRLNPVAGGRRHAQVTVEFALILLPFFILIFATIDIALYYYYDSSLQNAMRECAHFTASGNIIPAMSNGTNNVIYYNGVLIDEQIPDPIGGLTNASRDECSKLWFRSNIILPNVYWRTNIEITSQTNSFVVNDVGVEVPNVPTMSPDGETFQNPTFGPGAPYDWCQVVGYVQVNSITPMSEYLSNYQQQGGSYFLRASTVTSNEPNLLNFQDYPSTNPTEP